LNILEGILNNQKPIDAQIQSAEQELAVLDEKRKALQARIEQLKRQKQLIADEQLLFDRLSELNVTNDSTQEQKISLFRSLFRGREDVYPRRFESKRTGKSGFQPVCRNEWIRPICQKPKTKCGECENRDFMPLSNDVIRNHLIGIDPTDRNRREFVTVARQCKAKYVTGLSATVTRKDGHHPIIFMNCGPVRYKVDDKKQASERPFAHKVIVRETNFRMPVSFETDKYTAIHDIYKALLQNDERNHVIVSDVMNAVKNNRFPVILTERCENQCQNKGELGWRCYIATVLAAVRSMSSKSNTREM